MSASLTALLAARPLLGSQLAAGDIFYVADISASGIARSKAIIASELAKALNGFSEADNDTGDTTITIQETAISHLAVVDFTGAAGTRKLILSGTPQRGAVATLKLNMPATADILVEFYSQSDAGAALTSFLTDGSGAGAVARFYCDTAGEWQFLDFLTPVNA